MKPHRDKLPGGRADKLNPSDFNPKALAEGTKHEMEHTRDEGIAREIAMDHLAEDSLYYERLKRMEADAEKKTKLGKSLPFYLDSDEAMKGIFGNRPKKVKTFTAHGPPGQGGGKIATSPHGTYHAVPSPKGGHSIQFRPHASSKVSGGIVGHAPAQGSAAIRMARGHHNQFAGGAGKLKLKSLDGETPMFYTDEMDKGLGSPVGKPPGPKNPRSVGVKKLQQQLKSPAQKQARGARLRAQAEAAGRPTPVGSHQMLRQQKKLVGTFGKSEEPDLTKSYWAADGYDGCFDGMINEGE